MLLAVEAKNLKKTFKTKQGNVEAVRDVSFKVNKGEIFGILVRMVPAKAPQF